MLLPPPLKLYASEQLTSLQPTTRQCTMLFTAQKYEYFTPWLCTTTASPYQVLDGHTRRRISTKISSWNFTLLEKLRD